ncbi:capsular biosynthesis protein [Clostridium sp. 19966]|uniref:YveK family protein n=1 Tax=Clostridium sp. 19966 TaxID=2768166 RepID=UPI0028DE4E74|nr:GNVR domain-containing protein [Clostridium sp. 19966]MDT8716515.1 capsular biosynthesis protein [Clostridium sp. 19966]
MEIKEYFSILKKRYKLILWITLLAVITSGVFSYIVIKPTYKTNISVIIGKGESTKDSTYNYNDIMMYQNLVKTYVELTTSAKVMNDTISNLGLSLTADQLEAMISVSPKASTEFMDITVKSKSPSDAMNIANQLAKSLKSISATVMKEDNVQILDEAKLPTSPDSPKPLLNMMIAFLLGLMLSIGLLFLLEYMDNTVKTEEEIEKLCGVPVIGIIPLVTQDE